MLCEVSPAGGLTLGLHHCCSPAAVLGGRAPWESGVRCLEKEARALVEALSPLPTQSGFPEPLTGCRASAVRPQPSLPTPWGPAARVIDQGAVSLALNTVEWRGIRAHCSFRETPGLPECIKGGVHHTYPDIGNCPASPLSYKWLVPTEAAEML